jgi:hypothetical protein
MPYISNVERNRKIKKLDKNNGGRKFITATALLSGIILGVFVLLGILGQMNLGGANSALSNLQFIDQSKLGSVQMITWMG